MNEKLLEYAKMLIQIGLNVQKGQTLIISCPVDCAYFARMCAKEAYAVGCREVVNIWGDDQCSRMRFLNAEDDVFDAVPLWRRHQRNDYALENAAYLAISATDPENLKGVDPSRIVRTQQAFGKAFTDFDRLQMDGGFPWCIASVPIPSWANKVFPDAEEAQAMEMLWEAIFKTVRISGDGTCVEKWNAHLATLDKRMHILNDLHFKTLHYTNGLGTDLTIELPPTHHWESGESKTRFGQTFIANIPTEELFTAPLKKGINGVVYASMPLVNDGTIIDGFHMVVKEGKIVEVHAREGEDSLKAAISVDEGACYFGEVALVPYDSPISNQKILFYNTLFDENASCHLAFGEAYPCIEGGQDMTKAEKVAAGLNDSITHVDFMIGTADLSIVGTTQDGRTIPVFANGNFAI
ncbi:aminopeptidase [Bengtsoniella intestinalis]|uniref:aminopeptidase n=1 Tax=Bengtsoniella intestinalis TaxID=3073143 RepID=UPI00391F9054